MNLPLVSLAAIAKALGVTVSELTLGIDGAMPREPKTLEQVLAGRGRKEQIAITRVLTAMSDLFDEAKTEDDK